jgi:hypothetical protein
MHPSRQAGSTGQAERSSRIYSTAPSYCILHLRSQEYFLQRTLHPLMAHATARSTMLFHFVGDLIAPRLTRVHPPSRTLWIRTLTDIEFLSGCPPNRESDAEHRTSGLSLRASGHR